MGKGRKKPGGQEFTRKILRRLPRFEDSTKLIQEVAQRVASY